MADEQEQASEPQEQKKGGLSPVVIGVVAALMLVEFGAVAGFFMLAGGPKEAKAALDEAGEDPESQVEIELAKDQFQNMQANRVWLWDLEVFIKVGAENEEAVNKSLERRAAEIKSGIGEIVRRASHTQLREAGLETLNRQVSAYVHEVFGDDAEGEPRVQRVIISKCRGFPADF